MSAPPRLAEWLLGRCLPGGTVGESIRGDLRQELEELRERHPGRSFRAWYWRQALGLAGHWIVYRMKRDRGGSRGGRGVDAGASTAPAGNGRGAARRGRRRPAPGPDDRSSSRARILLDDLATDAWFGLRVLAHRPGITLVAILTLALGIGANTAVFSVVDGVLLRPLPDPEPERVVGLFRDDLADPEGGTGTTPANFVAWSERAGSFAAMGTDDGRFVGLRDGEETRRVLAMFSAGSLLEVAGRQPLIGRVPTAEEDRAGERLAVLSHSLWTTAFGADPRVLGRAVELGGDAYAIVGVMPPDFDSGPFAHDVDLWATAAWSAAYRSNRTNHAHRVWARLRPGVSRETARQEMETIAARLRREYPAANRDHGIEVRPLEDELVEDSRTLLLTLMGAVGLVLLIGCMNLANLLLARASARRPEMALRRALGAGPGRIGRQLLTEASLLALAGGVAGLVTAAALLDVVVALLPDDVPYLADVAIDPGVLGFTLAVSTLAGLLFGVGPALLLARGDARRDLDGAGRGSRRTGRSWSALVVAEVALSVVLLVGAGLLLRSFVGLATTDRGFDTRDVLTFRVSLPETGYDGVRRGAFWERLGAELETLPGVRAVGIASQLPARVNRASGWFDFADRPVADRDRSHLIPYRIVRPGHLEALGIPLVSGRGLRDDDGPGAPAAVVNEAARRRFWSGGDPLGDRIVLGGLDGEPWYPPLGVVGVAGDVRNSGLGAPAEPTIYLPISVASGWGTMTVALRADADPAGLAGAARARVRELEPGALVYDVATVEELYAEQIAPTRSVLTLLGFFAVLGLSMAAVGLFGVLSYLVSRRTREMGIRIALGADPRSLTRRVLGQSMGQALLGTALGAAGAAAAGRLLETLLYGVSPVDPLTLAAVAGTLLAVALVAGLVPARRAASVSPMETLRAD